MKTAKIMITALIAVLAVTFTGCTASEQDRNVQEETAAYTKISAEEAKAMMDKGKVTVVDVRRADEYMDRHIEGAVLVPNETIGNAMPSELPDKDATLLVYCRSGRRSREAAEKLIALGYKHVYDFGGIIDWPYATVRGN